ncbi:hypothetical protein VCRA2123O13_400001 [Vibrio crassostreae]|nr:hypothetical protein VCRA2110O4_430001 [Vibrio crassostreae]CAK3613570.1 hypothetical protein VCRA2123O13_400001 [Vibrio crassostreae]
MLYERDDKFLLVPSPVYVLRILLMTPVFPPVQCNFLSLIVPLMIAPSGRIVVTVKI